MNSENSPLPGFVLADLFKNSLVIMDNEQKAVKEKPKKAIVSADRQWYLGSNLRNITLIVNEKDAVYLPDDALQFLSSILGACKLNLGDVAIVNHHNDPLNYISLKEKLQPGFLILFGVSAQQIELPFTVPNFQVQKYDNCSFLLAPPLASMLGNGPEAKLEKSKLWLCLKNMFSI